jgi:hypothetical protein
MSCIEEHTQGTLEQQSLAVYADLDGRKTMVAHTGVASDAWVPVEMRLANANRFVVCWNAFVDTPTGYVKSIIGLYGNVRSFQRETEKEIETLQQEKDELVAGMKEASQLAREATADHPEAAAILIKLAQTLDALTKSEQQ